MNDDPKKAAFQNQALPTIYYSAFEFQAERDK